MNRSKPPFPSLPDRDQAALWVARMDHGADWTAVDEAALQQWLDGDPRRHGLLLQAQAAWELPGALIAADRAANGETSNEGGALADPATSRPGWQRRRVLGGMVAAGIAAVTAARYAMTRGAEYVTQLGEIRRVPLADGSVMTINSDTALKVNLTKTMRQIELAQGEAWFEVAKDAQRPFVVASGPVRAQAIGTAFSLRKRNEGVDVLVTEGLVEAWSATAAGQRLLVRAGERALISSHALVHYRAEETEPVDRALAWRRGMIDLSATTLRDAADEFNRYNQRQIVIADPALANEQFDGLFRIGDPEGFAEAIKAALGVTIDTSDPQAIRIGRGADGHPTN